MKAGTVMKGLSILKDTPDPIALPDEEYPPWVWTLTDAVKSAETNDKEKATISSANKSSMEQKESGFDLQAEKRKMRSA
jgi:large subunit ribosomal protein L54